MAGSQDARLWRATIGEGYVGTSHVEFVESSLQGDSGHDASEWFDATDGHPGLVISDGGHVHLALTDVRGGAGGSSDWEYWPFGGDGGNGVELEVGGELLVAGLSTNLIRGGEGGAALVYGSDGSGRHNLGVARVSGTIVTSTFPRTFRRECCSCSRATSSSPKGAAPRRTSATR